MTEKLHLVCSECRTVNRVESARFSEGPRCGRCKAALLDGQVRELTSADFTKFISKNELSVVVNFWASWCGHCRNFEPVFAAAAQQLKSQARLFRVETEEEPELARRFSIMSMPTHIIFKDGKELSRQSGAMQLPLFMAWLKSYF